MIRLVQTCWACPEQYDAFDGDRRVGYLRLRHGRFTVDYPDVSGVIIYSATPQGDGIFNEDERDYYLRFAVAAIEAAIRAEAEGREIGRPPAPDVEYRIES